MKALIVNGDNTLQLRTDIQRPTVGPYSAVVKTIACGICNGTDMKLKEGHLYGFDTFPAILGHEAVGEVIEVGDKVTSFQVGDHVLRCMLLGKQGEYHSLWGSFAEYTQVLDYESMTRDNVPDAEAGITHQIVPARINPSDATMIITLKEVYSALVRLGFQAGDSVAIAGCGPVGLAMVRFAKLMGASFVALSGHHDSRIAVAKKQGADLALNAKEIDFVEAVREAHPAPLDFYIDAVGRAGNISQAISLIKEDGTIGIYGIGIEEDRGIEWYNGPYNFKIHSVQWPIPKREADIHELVVEHVVNGEIDLKDFVTHTLPIEDYQEGFRLVESREGLKVVLTF